MNNKLLSIGKTAKILGVSIDTLRRWDKNGQLVALRLTPKGNRYYREEEIDLFLENLSALAKTWATTATPFEPDPKFHCRTRDVFQARLEQFQKDLKPTINDNLSFLISAVVGEIGNNSFDHNLGNWPDILGIFFSHSLSEKRVILADRGQGILTTLKRVKPDLQNHSEALGVAFTETISGRAPESRGNGLKFVRTIITSNPLELYFQTGNASLRLKQNNTDINVDSEESPIRGCLAVVEYK